MSISIFVVLTTLLAIFVLTKKLSVLKKRPVQTEIIGLLIFLCLLCSLRDDNIRDTSVYIDAFTIGDERLEIGFRYLVDIIKIISSYPPFVFGVIALFSVGLKLAFFRKYALYFLPTILVYFSSSFISEDFIAIRAALVNSLVLWAVEFAFKRRIIPFVLTIILATSFHVTAMVGILIWPIVNLKISLKNYFWFIPIGYLMFLSGRGFGYLATYIQIPYIQSLYALYSESDSVVNVFSFTQLIRSVFCMYVIWVNRYREMDEMYKSFLKMYCFAITLYVVLTDVPAFSARLTGLFAITGVLVIGNLFYYLPRLRGNLVRWMIVALAYIDLISTYLNVLN